MNTLPDYDGSLTIEQVRAAGALESHAWVTACLVRTIASMETFECRERFVKDFRAKHGDIEADKLIEGLKAERQRRLQRG